MDSLLVGCDGQELFCEFRLSRKYGLRGPRRDNFYGPLEYGLLDYCRVNTNTYIAAKCVCGDGPATPNWARGGKESIGGAAPAGRQLRIGMVLALPTPHEGKNTLAFFVDKSLGAIDSHF
eukprot:6180203-Pleurochrysis_carterae.AAC.2